MITIKDKKDCCGCGACAQVCAKHCITMTEDNEGFLYPEVDSTNCVECGMCEKICPIINVKPEEKKRQRGFLFQHGDETIRKQSTSGGAFTAIATQTLADGGVVFGATFGKEFNVHHIYIERTNDLQLFRNSKYVQSDMGDSYRQCRDFLKQGRKVLFSGTPCQIEGLNSYLRRGYDNLTMVDVVCHSVPSRSVFRKYIDYQKDRIGGEFENVLFRNKHYGYNYSTFSIINYYCPLNIKV